jgi:hypothetical protein
MCRGRASPVWTLGAETLFLLNLALHHVSPCYFSKRSTARYQRTEALEEERYCRGYLPLAGHSGPVARRNVPSLPTSTSRLDHNSMSMIF